MMEAGSSRLLSRGIHLDATSVCGPCYGMISESRNLVAVVSVVAAGG
jgi:hypothetical protein